MNAAALILMGKILAWILLSISTLMIVIKVILKISYEGSKEQMLHQMRGIKATYPWKLQIILFLISLFYIVGFWGVTQ